MCITVQYIHRSELPCDEDMTRIFKEKCYWVALGDGVPDLLELEYDDPAEQYAEPSNVRQTISDSGVLNLVPSGQEDHYHRIVFRDLMHKLDELPSDSPSGRWFFRCVDSD